MKIKKGDTVKITRGKDNGKEGVVEKVWLKESKVTVAGMNLYKRHLKARSEGQKSQIVEVPRALTIANVSLVCPKCKKVTRVGFKMLAKGKARICKKCEAEI